MAPLGLVLLLYLWLPGGQELTHTCLLLAHVQGEPVMTHFAPGTTTAKAAWGLSWIGVGVVQAEEDTMFLNEIQLKM